MTPSVPIRRCKRCLHYRRETCQLPDLDPCNFAPINGKTRPRCWARAEVYIIAALAIIAVAAICFACRKLESNPTESDGITIDAVSAVGLLRNLHRDDLTSWQLLQLAIIYTESRFNADALGAAGDAGLYQITPIYVAEVNRIAGTDYRPEDAFDPDKAVAIFAAMQDHYNPSRDTDLALHYHHKGESYRRAVLDNLEVIRRYEAARKAVTK